ANDDQRLLQETTRKFLDQRSPVSEVRRLEHDPIGFDRDVWRQSAELGWTSLFVPEEYDGLAESADGVVDAAIIAEQLGRVVFPGPMLAVNVVAAAVAASGTPDQREA